MINQRRILWLMTAVLVVIVALAACRPATEEENASAAESPAANVSDENPPTDDLPAPMNTPDPASPEPSPAAPEGDFPLSDLNLERIAGLPTPPPDAIVPTPADFLREDVSVRGSADAPVTIIEFSDYQCPYCQGYVNDAYPQIIEELVETGFVRYVFKDFPLESIHSEATKAAEAARCAGEQGSYWEMHDALFASQNEWSGQSDPVPVFVGLASDLGLDADDLESCVNDRRYADQVAADTAEGMAAGVTGTPSFFINGYPMVGGQPYEFFELLAALGYQNRLADAYAQVPTPTPMPPSEIPTEESQSLGSPDAPVTMIEYSDFQCPYCSRYSNQTFPQIKENYIDTGLVYYIFKDFPLTMHAQAIMAAQAARCAADQDAFWEMHALLFETQGEWGNDSAAVILQGFAQEMGLDTDVFGNCLGNQIYAQAVADDLMEGLSVGVSGTPAFFVNEEFISGAQPYEVFVQVIEAALESNQ